MGFLGFVFDAVVAIFNGFKRLFSSQEPIHYSSGYSQQHASYEWNYSQRHSDDLRLSRQEPIKKHTEFLEMGQLEDYPMPLSILNMERNTSPPHTEEKLKYLI